MKILHWLAVAATTFNFACAPKGPAALLSEKNFDTIAGGQKISLFTLSNREGTTAQITNYGGRVVALWTKDRDGEFRDVVLGFDRIDAYLGPKAGNQGAVVGRFANRIEGREFSLDGVRYLLAGNPEAQIAPVGVADFNRAPFIPRPFVNEKGEQALELKYLSPDGEAGFPGNLTLTVVYTLTQENALQIDYTATTDAPTIVNLTNHSFFNLRGGVDDIGDYELTVDADYYLPIKEGTIPTGEIASVDGTPLDFRTPQRIGARIDDDFDALLIGDGYDQCFVLNVVEGELTPVATLYDPVSGIVMETATTQPGMQLYTGNKLAGMQGKEGKVYERRWGACLETMHFPDAPHHENFPSTVLRPGEVFQHTCSYRFSTRSDR